MQVCSAGVRGTAHLRLHVFLLRHVFLFRLHVHALGAAAAEKKLKATKDAEERRVVRQKA
jgi:hypothetical protein